MPRVIKSNGSREPFNEELRLFLAPRVDPASNPGPPANPAVDERALRRAAQLLSRVIG